MSIETDLRKDGIEVIEKLDTLKTNSIAQRISKKLCGAFPLYGLDQKDLFIRLSRLNMYIARMPNGMSEANYFYKNTSIYFNETADLDNLDEFAIHECIHYLQEVKDNKNYLIKMGLCDYSEFKVYGLGINEAAVQLMASIANNSVLDSVKYFGINFTTVSPSYYPLECCLLTQMAYVTGEDVLFDSTLNSNDNFKIKFANLTSKKTYIAVQNAIDDIMDREEEIIKLNNKIATIDDRTKRVDNMIQKINELKHEILLTFMRTQNLIFSSYFDKEFDEITKLEEIEPYRKRLYEFKDLIGIADGYTFFDDYYIEKVSALNHKANVIENGGMETSINIRIEQKENFLLMILRKIKKLILGNSQESDVTYNESDTQK